MRPRRPGSDQRPRPASLFRGDSLWQNRDFNVLWLTASISSFGSQTAAIAYPLLVLAITHSATKAGIVITSEAIADLIGGSVGGVIVDRYNRRIVMVCSELTRFGAMTALGVVIALHDAHLWEVAAVAGLDGFLSTPVSAAVNAALVRVVPGHHLEQAIAQDQARSQGAYLAGPPVGGLLFGLSAACPFLANAFSYLVSAAGIVCIRASLATEREPRPASFWSEFSAGFRWLLSRQALALLFASLSFVNLCTATIPLTIIVLARSDGATSPEIGVALSIGAVGGIVGSAAAPFLVRRVGRVRLFVLCMWSIVILVPALALPRTFFGFGLIFGAIMVTIPTASVIVNSRLMREMPDEVRGRVLSALAVASGGLAALGPLMAGLLLESLGSSAPLILGLPAVATALIATLSPQVRRFIAESDDGSSISVQ